jgi:hypothetical protein
MSGNLDGFGAGRNYYLYKTNAANQYYVIGGDFQSTFGQANSGNLSSTLNLYEWSSYPLVKRVLESPFYRNKFTNYFWELLYFYRGHFEDIAQRIQSYYKLLELPVKLDLMHKFDRGFSAEDCYHSTKDPIIVMGTKGDAKWGDNALWIMPIMDFIKNQATNAFNQLDAPSAQHAFKHKVLFGHSHNNLMSSLILSQ